MKFLILALLALGLSIPSRAEEPVYAPERLDELVAPIALYPDALVALILPASIESADVSSAADFLDSDPTGVDIDQQPWDASVKALARYPSIVIWMDDNIEWTQTLGAAFAQQRRDVMKAVQRMRMKAYRAGNLVTTSQQRIEVVDGVIRILPGEPNILYVPEYDPNLAYVVRFDYTEPLITYGFGFPVGIWLAYECDWDDFGIWTGPWRGHWTNYREWHRSGWGRRHWRRWEPDIEHCHRVVHDHYRPGNFVPRPSWVVGHRPHFDRDGRTHFSENARIERNRFHSQNGDHVRREDHDSKPRDVGTHTTNRPPQRDRDAHRPGRQGGDGAPAVHTSTDRPEARPNNADRPQGRPDTQSRPPVHTDTSHRDQGPTEVKERHPQRPENREQSPRVTTPQTNSQPPRTSRDSHPNDFGTHAPKTRTENPPPPRSTPSVSTERANPPAKAPASNPAPAPATNPSSNNSRRDRN